MPGTIVVAATATGVQPKYALLVGGTNVLTSGGGTSWGSSLESIEVTEAGPGGVSSMTFRIDDPARELALTAGAEVAFWDMQVNYLLFRGYVDHWDVSPAFGTGRLWAVSAIGVEAWLDWLRYYPGTTSGAAFGLNVAIRGAALGHPGPLVAAIDTAGSGELRAGIAQFLGAYTNNATVPTGTTLAAGATLRETINTLIAVSSITPEPTWPIVVHVTVDWYMTLRVWDEWVDKVFFTLNQPDDYGTLTVTDTTAGTKLASNLEYSVEPGDSYHEVYVAGGNPAGTGLFADGTGLKGPQGLITDALILTAADAQTRAQNFLAAQNGSTVRGSFTLEGVSGLSTIHAGSVVSIVDAQVGLNGVGNVGAYRIFEIRKTFNGGTVNAENWTIAFGGMPPSAARLIRKLTRAVAA